MIRRLALILPALLCLAGTARADGPKVVATIPPLHGLVAAVMEGVGAPRLLLRSGSPHGYVLRPSDARTVAAAGLIFLIHPRFEPFLGRALSSLPKGRSVVAATAPGIALLRGREGGVWKDQDHDHGHDHGGEAETDFHIWLSPANARAIAAQARAALSKADPANAARYATNATRLTARITATETRLKARLAPVRGVPYIVFHDAYHYFEDAFGLTPAGAVTASPDRKPGIRRLRELRAAIAARGARCVFAEPQFPPALVRTIVEDTQAKPATLDPLGATARPGPDAWFTVMDGLAQSLHGCLASVR
jgi:zinc transport system substrate-binding protein